jgi:hypothetical protein
MRWQCPVESQRGLLDGSNGYLNARRALASAKSAAALARITSILASERLRNEAVHRPHRDIIKRGEVLEQIQAVECCPRLQR